MNARKLGKTGPDVFPIALGCMGMTGGYGKTTPEEGIATIHAAVDRGVTLIDTGDFYAMGENELLVGRALAGGRRDKVLVSVKFGAQRGPDGAWLGFDGSPTYVKTSVAYSLKRLGIDHIDVYRPARLDPRVPIEDTIGAVADLVKAGYVKHIGLSEVGVETIRKANEVHPIADLQIEYSLASRGPEDAIFPVLEELGISATLYGILSRGLLSGSTPGGAHDYRSHLPRFTGEDGKENAELVAALARFAEKTKRTPAELATGWALQKQPRLVPLVGARTKAQLEDALNAVERPLSQEEMAELERIIPKNAVKGDRYPAFAMKQLDSER